MLNKQKLFTTTKTQGGTEHSVVFYGLVGIISSTILLAKFPLRFTVMINQYTGTAI
jgi:hypothetical protein